MKSIKFLYFALLALVGFAFAACTTDEAADYETGSQIYFSTEFDTDHLVKDGDEYIVVPLRRIDSSTAVTVSILSYDPSGIFAESIPSEVKFYKGEDKVDLMIRVPKAMKTGVKYSISLLINDEENTTAYGNIELNFTVRLWPWERIVTADGKNKGKYRDDVVCAMFYGETVNVETDIVIYEHNKTKGLYLVEDMFNDVLSLFFGVPTSDLSMYGVGYYTTTDIQIDATNPEKVFIETQPMGYYLPGFGDTYISSPYNGDGTEPSMTGTLENGVITFPVNGLVIANSEGYGAYVNNSGAFRIVLPGYDVLDMALSAKFNDMTVDIDGNAMANIDFTYGADVSSIKYTFVEGNIPVSPAPPTGEDSGEGEEDGEEPPFTRAAAEEVNAMGIAEQIAAGTLTEGVFEQTTSASTNEVSVQAQPAKPGLYTLVAVPCNTFDGAYPKEFYSDTFYYQGADGEPAPAVDITLEVKKVSEAAPESMGQYPDTEAMHIKISGTDLKVVKTCVTTLQFYNDLGSYNLTKQSFLDQYASDDSAAILAQIEDAGYATSILSGLEPDTEYIILIEAMNIYGKKTVVETTYKSATEPKYSGELKVGRYFMSEIVEDEEAGTSVMYRNVFKVKPTEGSDTLFHVVDLAAEGLPAVLNAVYDPQAHTLTLDGTSINVKAKSTGDYTTLFGESRLVYDEASKVYYSYYSSLDEASSDRDYTRPLVFKVDPQSKEICGLNTYLELAIWQDTEIYNTLIFSKNANIVPYGYSTGNSSSGDEESGDHEHGASAMRVSLTRDMDAVTARPITSVTVNPQTGVQMPQPAKFLSKVL